MLWERRPWFWSTVWQHHCRGTGGPAFIINTASLISGSGINLLFRNSEKDQINTFTKMSNYTFKNNVYLDCLWRTSHIHRQLQHNITSYIKVTKFKYLCGAYNGILDLIQPTVKQCAQGNAWFRMCFSLWKDSNYRKPAYDWMAVSMLPSVMSVGRVEMGVTTGEAWTLFTFFYVTYTNIHTFLNARAHSVFQNCTNMSTQVLFTVISCHIFSEKHLGETPSARTAWGFL